MSVRRSGGVQTVLSWLSRLHWVADPKYAAIENATVESGAIYHGIEHRLTGDLLDVPARRRQARRVMCAVCFFLRLACERP
jgi:hypothetical protein